MNVAITALLSLLAALALIAVVQLGVLIAQLQDVKQLEVGLISRLTEIVDDVVVLANAVRRRRNQ